MSETKTRLSELVTASAPPEGQALAQVVTRRPEVLTPSDDVPEGLRLISSNEAIAHKSGHSPRMGNLAGAMAKAQGQIQLVLTNQEGKAKGKVSGVEFTFDYADLGAIIDAVSGPLSANGIARFQPAKIAGNKAIVTTLLVHESGEWIAEQLELTIEQGVLTWAQACGGTISYARRYGLAALVGIGTADGEDLDSHAPPSSPVRQGPVPMPQRAPSASPPSAASATSAPRASTAPLPGSPAPAQTPAPTGAVFTITAIEARRTTGEKAKPYWLVQFSNGVIASTFDAQMGPALVKAHEAGTRYSDVVITNKGNYAYIDEVIPEAW